MLVAMSAACSRKHPVELQVGEQRLSIVIPNGWEHLDYGDRHQLRHGTARIAIEEAGGAPDKALRRLGEDEQRDVASRTPLQIGNHEALMVDTWDRLSHTQRKRFCFVQGEGPRLVIYIQHGRFESVQPDFDALIASVALVDSIGASVVGGDEAQAQ
jgi:hypothetical protein